MLANNSKLNDTVKIYVTSFDSDVVVGEVAPAIRNELIQRCTDTLAKQQRYCAWMLLDYALRECYGGGVADFDFHVDDNGKWNCSNGVHFSLSHCYNVVAVAVCNSAVGVDVELVDNFVNRASNEKFIRRVLTDGEQQLSLHSATEHRAKALAQTWTQKESIFKLQSGKVFTPKSIDTANNETHSQFLTVNSQQYSLSVATHRHSEASGLTVDTQVVTLNFAH